MISSSTATNVAWAGTIVLILGFVQSARYAYRAREASKKGKWFATIENLVVTCVYVVVIYSGTVLISVAVRIG
jgi:putative copper export protein